MGGTTVALALGSGGARGYAHIGVLEELEARGYDVVSIAGTSMGALVGGLHAAGVLADYRDWVTGLSQRDVLRLLDPTLSAPGVIRGEKILAKVRELVGERTIEDLEVPFTAVATDLLAQKEVWFQRGPLHAAIRASIAIPSVITPVVLGGRLLADGALMNPLPVAPTSAARAELTIGVTLSHEDLLSVGGGPGLERFASAEPDGREPGLASSLFDAELFRTVAGWFGDEGEGAPEEAVRDAERAVEEADEDAEVFGTLPDGLRTSDVTTLAVDAQQSVVLRYRLAGYPPDLLITVPKASARTLDFHRAGEMVEVGRERAAEVLDRFEARRASDAPAD